MFVVVGFCGCVFLVVWLCLRFFFELLFLWVFGCFCFCGFWFLFVCVFFFVCCLLIFFFFLSGLLVLCLLVVLFGIEFGIVLWGVVVGY